MSYINVQNTQYLEKFKFGVLKLTLMASYFHNLILAAQK
jgi:hypothetical protein